MARKVTYWVTTGLLAALSLFGAYAYLTGSQEAVKGFSDVGYPQQLRVLLGIAKLAGAIVLVMPGMPTLKEWTYAGFTFTWIAAFIAHYLAGDGPVSAMPLVLLVFLGISYITRPANRRWQARAALA